MPPTTTCTQYHNNAGSQRVSVRTGNSTLNFILGDHLGSTSVTTSSTGTSPKYQLYKPWGEVRYTSSALPTKYTFTGQYSNVADFGLMYYGARWYDVSLGRFAQADTIIPGAGNPQSWDRFAYVNNNPLRYTDPSGHMCSDPEAPNQRCDGGGAAKNYYGYTGGSNKTALIKHILLPMVLPSWNSQRQGVTVNPPTIGPLETPFVGNPTSPNIWDKLRQGQSALNWAVQTPHDLTLSETPGYDFIGGYRAYADIAVEQDNGALISMGASSFDFGPVEVSPYSVGFSTGENWLDGVGSNFNVNVPDPWTLDLSVDLAARVQNYNITTTLGLEYTVRPDTWIPIGVIATGILGVEFLSPIVIHLLNTNPSLVPSY